MINLGLHLEYFLRPLEEFVYPYTDISFNPFFTFGIQYSFYNNSLKSELGNWQEDIAVLPKKYTEENSLDIGSGEAFAFNIGLGTRYKLTEKLDLSAQFNYSYFFSDTIDGLKAEVFENRNNEWALTMQVGLIYHLNFSTPLFY